MLKYLLAALLSAGTVSVSYTAVVELYKAAHQDLKKLEALRDASTEQAARFKWRLDGRAGTPTVDDLIAAGYIAESYRNRPKVGEAIELPAELHEGAAQ